MRRARAEEIFLALGGRSADERSRYLDSACGADLELRRAVEDLERQDASADLALRGSIAAQACQAERRRIGPYRLVQRLGQGGMGTVYLAARDDEQYEKHVAIKVARGVFPTPESQRRFRYERQILATLEHPNIARLLEGGATADGEPYIVMEYVEGLPIAQYVKAANLPPLRILALFLKAASAVDFAHRRLIVHRDLKPSNILVTPQGEPKLLDFGIAKMLDGGETAYTQTPFMTPEYSSPEQLAGQPVTVSADVFSLGVILNELLAGQRRKADLDYILRQSVDPDPRRRYSTVGEFAADIERFLSGRPVLARSPTPLYRLSMLLRRHRVRAAVAALLLCSVAAGWWSTARESRRTQLRLTQLRQLAHALIFDLHDRIRDLPGSTEARVHLVETAQAYMATLEQDAAGDQALRTQIAASYERLGDLQGGVELASAGRVGAAVESYRKALALLASSRQQPPALLRQLATLRIKAANALGQRGASSEALAMLRGAAGAAGQAWRLDPSFPNAAAMIEADYRLGDWFVRKGRAIEALPHAERGWQTAAGFAGRHPGADSRKALWIATRRLGEVNLHCGRIDEARRLFADAAAVHARDNPAFDREGMLLEFVRGNVAGNPFYIHAGDYAAAESHYRAALAWARSRFEHDRGNATARADYAIALVKLANVLGHTRPLHALPLYEEALAIRRRQRGDAPENVELIRLHAYDLAASAVALLAAGRAADAERRLRLSIDLDAQMVRRDPVRVECCSDIPLYSALLGDSLAAQAKFTGALAAYSRAREIAEFYGRRDTCGIFCIRDWAEALHRLAVWHRDNGNPPQAAKFAAQSASVWRLWTSNHGSNPYIEKKLAILGSLVP